MMTRTYEKKIRSLIKFMKSNGAPAALVSLDFIATLMAREAAQNNLSLEESFDAVDRIIRKRLAATIQTIGRLDDAARRLAEASGCPLSETRRTMIYMVEIAIRSGNAPDTSYECIIQQTDVLVQHVKSGRIKVKNGMFSLADILAAYPEQARH